MQVPNVASLSVQNHLMAIKKHPDAPKQIVPNVDTAPIVKRIFSLSAKGLGPNKIARMLKEEQILTHTVYDFRTNGVRHTNLNEHKPFAQDKMLNSGRFLKLVEKYTDIQELTPELVREFIDKILVHERSEPHKKKNYTQHVDVYFNFVDMV